MPAGASPGAAPGGGLRLVFLEQLAERAQARRTTFLTSLLRPARPRHSRETESGWKKATGIFLSICSRQISAATLDRQKPSLSEGEMDNGAASGDLALGHERLPSSRVATA